MKKILPLIFLLTTVMIQDMSSQNVRKQRICHSVVFNLRHSPGSTAERDFLEALKKLSDIPGVRNLRLSPEVSKKNNFDFHLSMEFDDQEAYDSYNNHPDHVSFVRQRWMNEVQDFLEIDYLLDN